MPKSPLALKATITKRPAEPVPSDMAERLEQLCHDQAETAGASTGAEPAQSPDPDKSRQTAVEAATAIEPEKSGKLKWEAHALQAAFLSGNLGKPITVFTLNGVSLVGRLRQFDQYCLLLEGPAPLLIFKHAVSTITPAR